MQTIKAHVDKDNQVLFKDFKGEKVPNMHGKTTLISRKGACQLLVKTRKLVTKDVECIFRECGIESLNKKSLTKEQQTLSPIINLLKRYAPQDQYPVGKYRLDVYFPEYRIVVECDEHGHADRHPEAELERERFVNEELNLSTDNWVRYNPDAWDFDLQRTIRIIIDKIERIKEGRHREELEAQAKAREALVKAKEAEHREELEAQAKAREALVKAKEAEHREELEAQAKAKEAEHQEELEALVKANEAKIDRVKESRPTAKKADHHTNAGRIRACRRVGVLGHGLGYTISAWEAMRVDETTALTAHCGGCGERAIVFRIMDLDESEELMCGSCYGHSTENSSVLGRMRATRYLSRCGHRLKHNNAKAWKAAKVNSTTPLTALCGRCGSDVPFNIRNLVNRDLGLSCLKCGYGRVHNASREGFHRLRDRLEELGHKLLVSEAEWEKLDVKASTLVKVSCGHCKKEAKVSPVKIVNKKVNISCGCGLKKTIESALRLKRRIANGSFEGWQRLNDCLAQSGHEVLLTETAWMELNHNAKTRVPIRCLRCKETMDSTVPGIVNSESKPGCSCNLRAAGAHTKGTLTPAELLEAAKRALAGVLECPPEELLFRGQDPGIKGGKNQWRTYARSGIEYACVATPADFFFLDLPDWLKIRGRVKRAIGSGGDGVPQWNTPPGSGESGKLHRHLIELTPEEKDARITPIHVNRNKRDNRRLNFMKATPIQQAALRRGSLLGTRKKSTKPRVLPPGMSLEIFEQHPHLYISKPSGTKGFQFQIMRHPLQLAGLKTKNDGKRGLTAHRKVPWEDKLKQYVSKVAEWDADPRLVTGPEQ